MRILSTDPSEPGIIAVGQVACGVFAFGQSALGVVAVGQLSRGLFCVGQLAVGVVAVGQGAVGLWHGTGMVGLAGQRGWGFVLHTLPRISRVAPALDLPPSTPIAELISGGKERGWLPARLDASGAIRFDEGTPPVDTRVVPDPIRVRAAIAQRHDRAHVLVRAEISEDATAYREGKRTFELRAEDVITYSSRRTWAVRYHALPTDQLDASIPSGASIALRTIVWLVAALIVWMIAVWPLAHALVGWPSGTWWGTMEIHPSNDDDPED